MKILGFNIAKGRLTYCLIEGPKTAARALNNGYEKFDPARPIADIANSFGKLENILRSDQGQACQTKNRF